MEGAEQGTSVMRDEIRAVGLSRDFENFEVYPEFCAAKVKDGFHIGTLMPTIHVKKIMSQVPRSHLIGLSL